MIPHVNHLPNMKCQALFFLKTETKYFKVSSAVGVMST